MGSMTAVLARQGVRVMGRGSWTRSPTVRTHGRSRTWACVVVGACCCGVIAGAARANDERTAGAPSAIASAVPSDLASEAPFNMASAAPFNIAFATPFSTPSAAPSIRIVAEASGSISAARVTGTLPFSFPVGDEVSAPTRFWRDGRLLVTHTFRSASALPVVAARLSAQARATPTVMTVPDGLLMSGMHNRMWWSVHLQDANGAGAYRTQGTMVGSLMLLDADGVTPVAPASPALPAWMPRGGMRVLDTRAVHGDRCHIHQVLTFTATAASTLGDFDIALDREGWVRQPGSASSPMRHWQRAGMRLELIVVPREVGSGAVLHVVAPLPRVSLAKSPFAPPQASTALEPPCKDL